MQVALRSLVANKLRSGLTMLGIVIGVGAVIALVAVGAGAQAEVAERFESLGANMLTIRPGAMFFRGRSFGSASAASLTNKYAEGYPHKRYYGGCEYVDVAEELAIERARKLFGADYANVQPHSGSQANQSVMLALIKPGDTVLGMSLAAGGHLTHGAPPNLSGKWFNAVQYGVTKDTNLIDYDEVERLAKEHKPALIIAGGSAYPRIIDFARCQEIADEVGAYLLADIAHIAGLVAAGLHPSPVPHAHVVTSTTHKTLRGPRGGLIVCRKEWIKAVNSAVFPGGQGGPFMHVIAAKAIALKEALQP